MSSPVVLITGALTGIGRATAFAFAREGARIVTVPRYVDKQLAEKIMQLDAGLLERAMRPFLTDNEIAALKVRLYGRNKPVSAQIEPVSVGTE